MKKILCIILLLMLALVVSGCTGQRTTPPATTAPTGEIKEFEITAKQFSFEPNVITVNKGDRVKLKVTSADVTHGFSINEFGVTQNLEPGKTATVEFVADKSGTFPFYCSVVCGSGHSGMKGQLVVK